MFNFKFDREKLPYYAAVVALLVIIFTAGFFIGKAQVVCKVCKPEQVDFSLFWDAYNKLSENFVDPGKMDTQKIIYGAIAGMAKSLGDPHTDFFDPDQARQFEQDLSGSFEGIGAEVGIKKGQLIIIAPLKGAPAEGAGLKAGDQILKINDKSTFEISVDEAVNMIRGRKGTEVTLNIFREEWGEPRDIKIVRDTIRIKSVEWELKDENIAYIHISHFDQPLSADFRRISREILSSPAKKIVLDLRNNPGGYLEVSQDVAGFFLQNGQVVTIEDFGEDAPKKEYLAEGTGTLADYPIVVLINEGSASASEILAGALKDNRGVQLIGEKSFGKGSVQEVIRLQDGKSFLKVTIAKWLTPKSASISEVGLTPDVTIELDEAEPDKDTQLQKALEIIKGLE